MEAKKKKLLTIIVIAVVCVAIITCSITIPLVMRGKKNKGPVCDHEFLPATCTSPARCIKCNATTGEKLDHGFTETIEEVAATCFADGYTVKECPYCHEQRSERDPQKTHSYKVDDTAPASEVSCVTDEIATYKCEHCGDTYSQVTHRRTGHNPDENGWVEVSSVPSGSDDCTVVITEKTSCLNEGCDEEVTRVTTLKHHATVSVEDTVDATCVSKGKRVYHCECGDGDHTVDIPVNPYAHNWGNPDGSGVSHCTTAGCSATKKVVNKNSGDPITAAELTGDNVTIAMDNVTFAPDNTLAGKMTDTKLEVSTANVNIANQNAVRFDLSLTDSADSAVNFDTGKMHVGLPVDIDPTANPEEYRVMYIDTEHDDQLVDMGASYANGAMNFEAEHFSYYTVVRLSGKQLCAAIGHNYDTTVVEPTCTVGGFTVKHCRRCGYMERSAPTPKKGHDMQTTVVPPTCVERGYTIYTCANDCGETYISNYTATVPHSYAESVVAPTCTKSGYTLHECSVCHAQYRDTFTDATGHTFSNGTCSVCGISGTTTAAETNFYVNLINSLSLFDGYYASSDGFTVSMSQQDVSYDNYRITFRIDENGNIVGGGEGRGTADLGNNRTSTADSVLVFRDGKVYTYSEVADKDGSVLSRNVNYSLMSQSKYFGPVASFIGGDGTDGVMAVIGKILDPQLDNSPTETIAKRVFEYLFTKTETANSVELTLDFDKVKELVETCKTESMSAVADKILGDGAYAKIASMLDGLPEKNLVDVLSDVAELIEVYGLTVDEITGVADDILHMIAPDIELDISELFAEFDSTIADLVTELGGDGEAFAAAWAEKYEAFNTLFTDDETSALDAVLTLIGEELPDEMLDMVDGIIDSLKASVSVKIATDKTGKVETIKIVADECEMDIAGEKVSIDGAFEIVPTGDREIPSGKFDRTVATLNSAVAYVPTTRVETVKSKRGVKKVFMPVEIDGKDLMAYGYAFENVRVAYRSDEPESVEFNGKACTRRVAYIPYSHESLAVYDPANIDGFRYSSSCGGYKDISISCTGTYQLCYYVYFDESSKLVGWEFAPQESEEEEEHYYYRSIQFYYNTVTRKYTVESPHEYVIVDKKAPVSCAEDGYETYRCSVCGDSYKRYIGIPHSYEYKYEFENEGSTSCEQGIVITATCSKCGFLYTNKTKYHEKYRHVVAKSTCGASVYRYECLCGEKNDNYYQFDRNGCTFSTSHKSCEIGAGGKCEHGYEQHEITEYTCSECGFKVTENTARITDGCKITYKNYYEVNGARYDGNKGYAYYSHTPGEEQVTTSGNVTTRKVTCEECGKTVRESRFETFTEGGKTATRPLYDFEGSHGQEFVYQPNSCVVDIYMLDENGERTGEKHRTEIHADVVLSRVEATCTRHGSETRKCLVCGDEREQIVSPRHHELYYDYETQTIKCHNCENAIADQYYYYNYWWQYFGFDDLTEVGTFKIGYAMWDGTVANHLEFVVDYDIGDNDTMLGEVVDIDFDQTSIVGSNPYEWGYDGYIELDTEALKTALEAYPDYSTFSVVVTIKLRPYEDDVIQYALNFNREEMNLILGL